MNIRRTDRFARARRSEEKTKENETNEWYGGTCDKAKQGPNAAHTHHAPTRITHRQQHAEKHMSFVYISPSQKNHKLLVRACLRAAVVAGTIKTTKRP